ncbi:MAG TPA: hypothetical protein VHQ86_04930 [Candidatus Saccharimonadia bacterium]|jgi:hypothetical protein|nr:hypothetical protein [Candidatus Saccharimonadia bacterium]
MTTIPEQSFICRLYVPARRPMRLMMPAEPGPMPVAKLEPLAYDKLIDPSFRRLLAAFESIPQMSLQSVQV